MKSNAATPPKEVIRAWLKTEVARHRPPPTGAEIRRVLGWAMIEAQRKY